VLYCSIATTQNPATYKTLPYDPLKDLIAVAILAESPNLVAVSTANIQAKTLGEFADLVKKSPGKYHLGGAGGQLMTMQEFMLAVGLKMEIVNYRSAADATTAMMSGEIDAQLNNVPTLSAGVHAGKIRLLAVTSNNRLKAFPDVPTTPELGYPDYVDSSYIGLYVPAATPPEIVNRLHAAAMRAIATPEVLKRFEDLDFVAGKFTQPQADAFYRSEIARWKDVVKKANIPLIEE
jgi:tripartite-type tricarboxylate transporter receptor subunit TctC